MSDGDLLLVVMRPFRIVLVVQPDEIASMKGREGKGEGKGREGLSLARTYCGKGTARLDR